MTYVPPFAQSDADRFYNGLIKDMDAKIAAKDATIAELEAENTRFRDALRQCQTHIAGFNVRSHEDAMRALSECNNELQRIHRATRAALEATGTPEDKEQANV